MCHRVRGIVMAMLAAVAGPSVFAASITVDSVTQRWPWNNKVDITYTIAGGQNIAAGVYCKVEFTATVGGVSYTINGSTLGADPSDGQHTVTWTAPEGLKDLNCTMTARLLTSEGPSGNDYMIIDLETGAVTYEGVGVTDFNTDTYKTTKMVLRKVAKGGPYPTGGAWGIGASRCPNSRKMWTTQRDYYIGIFAVTQSQYDRIMGGGEISMKPKVNISWDDLRDSYVPTDPVAPNENGGFFARLNARTRLESGLTGFDLPTEVMFEIAERAGMTTLYFWGDEWDASRIVSKDSGNALADVGSRPPNAWGLYDLQGNVYEWCLDYYTETDMALLSDAFTPMSIVNARRRCRSSCPYNMDRSHWLSLASARTETAPTTQSAQIGFRVAFIVR